MVVLIAPRGPSYERCLALGKAAKEIGAPVVGLLEEGDRELAALCAYTVVLPDVPELLSPILAVVPLQLFLGVRHDGEVLGRHPVSLRAVPVAAEGDSPFARLASREDDPAGDSGRQVLLEDAAVDDFTDQVGHTVLRSKGSFGQVV